MPAVQKVYRINFRNKELVDIAITITDWKLSNDDSEIITYYIDLIGVAPALEIETFNTNEDKFETILSQRATIKFKSTNAVNFATFATGEDYRFFVRATYDSGTKFIFSGWLIMDENQQAYLPQGQPVTLFATDNLGSLKDIELSDFDDLRPEGKYRLIEILAWCLNKTEGNLNFIDGIKVADSLYETNHVDNDDCPLNQTYVDILTFEKAINELKDCYTVLHEILFSIGARVCYYNNYWYIIRIDEYKNGSAIIHNYNAAGTYIDTETISSAINAS